MSGLLSPKQLQAIAHAQSDVKLFGAVGAWRAGKTAGTILGHAPFTLNPDFSDYDHAIVAVSEGSAKRNLIYPQIGYIEAYRSLGLNPTLKSSSGMHIEIKLPGRTVRVWIFGVADATAAIRRISGSTLASFNADEVDKYHRDVWKVLYSRLTPEGSKGWANLNPAGLNHFYKKDVIDGNYSAQHVTYVMTDNPSLSDEYIEEQRRTLTGHMYRRYFLGEWADATGLIYPHWHYVQQKGAIELEKWEVGVDWASSGVFAAVLRGSKDKDAVIWNDYGHNAREDGPLTDEEHAFKVHGWLRRAIPGEFAPGQVRIIGDPTTSAGFQKAIRRIGYRWTDGDNRVLPGLQYCATRLQTKKTRIHPNATGLIEELSGYSWDDTAAAKGEDKPVKEADHYCDAFRYVEFRPPPARDLGNVAGF